MRQSILRIGLAGESDREAIYRLRHQVYAAELGQHLPNPAARLTDACDAINEYLAAWSGPDIAGFVSLTPPGGRYSVDKYLARTELPFPVTDSLYEVRLLTVCKAHRRTALAALLLYAALRAVESRGGTRIMAMGRQALRTFYQKAGLHFFGLPTKSGAVTYELMSAETAALRNSLAASFGPLLARLQRKSFQRKIIWDLPFSFQPSSVEGAAACPHGGASFDAVGTTFQTLERRYEIVNADVLDAWFPPAPGVLAALTEPLSWLLQTSPPVDGSGLVQTIAEKRGLPPESVLLGAGSSALLYLALRHWLSPASRVLLIDPTYGEYAYLLEQVIGCRVDRLPLDRADGYRLDLNEWAAQIRRNAYDLAVLVNPNNPTGGFVARQDLEAVLADVPFGTQVWVDEAYINYVGPDESLETFAAHSRSVVICKSLSKCYALSGVRAAYLCGPPGVLRGLRQITPPWSVSLPAQVAAVAALSDPAYYAARYAETASLRVALAASLRRLAPILDVGTGIANFLLCHLPLDGPDAATVSAQCSAQGVFLRDAASISPRLGTHSLRLAVKDAAGSARIVSALAAALSVL